MHAARLGWIALNCVAGIGAVRAARLAAAAGGPARVFTAPAEMLASESGVDRATIDRLAEFPWRARAERECEIAAKLDCRILTLADEDYPPLLREIPAPPIVLTLRGTLTPADGLALAVVGTRRPSAYGLGAARRLTRELVAAGWTVISGLASGIDAEAHRTALAAGGRTLAVLAHGLDRVYPRAHAALARDVARRGALISEFCFGTPPWRGHFPQRNRCLSGLARGTLVVEAGETSGALITAKWALEQNREVFAVPGPIHAVQSRGTHALIQAGAKLVTRGEDILDEFPALAGSVRPAADPTDASRDPVLACLDAEGRHIDVIADSLDLPVGRVLAELARLELAGSVRALPGGLYART